MRPLQKGSVVGSRRGRTIATASIGVAALVGAMATALPAAAATAPSYSAEFDVNQIANDGTDNAILTLTVDNSAADSADISPVEGKITVTVPEGLDCTLSVAGPWTVTNDIDSVGALAQPDSDVKNVCTADVTFLSETITKQTKSTAEVSVTLDGQSSLPYTTGTVKVDFTVVDSAGTIGTASASVDAVNPEAPKFVEGDVPAPVPGQEYSYQIVDPLGVPADGAGYAVFWVTLNDDGSYDNSGVVSASGDGTFALDNDIIFDPATGKLTSDGKVGADASSNKVYTIIANASGTVATTTPTGAGNWIGDKPVLAGDDFASPQFTVASPFTDTAADSTFGEDIYTLAQSGVINGYPDGSFKPVNDVTRAQFAAFLARAAMEDSGVSGISDGTCTTPSLFPDVRNNSEFCAAINSLYGAGVINGDTSGNFNPGAKVTRAQITAFLHRAHSELSWTSQGTATLTPPTLSDIDSSPFKADITWAASADSGSGQPIVGGYTNGTFKPGDNASRQVVAAFVYRFGNYESISW